MVEYSFDVDGQTRSANRISFGDHFRTSRDEAKAVIEPWTIGESFPVHYNPERPEAAVLLLPDEPGWRLTDYVGVLLIALSALIFGLAWRGLRDGSNDSQAEAAA